MRRFVIPGWLILALMTAALGVAVWVVAKERIFPDAEFTSVGELVQQVEATGPRCGGALEVQSRKVPNDGGSYETGDCDSFNGVDVANFYWFEDAGAMDAYIAYQEETSDRPFEPRGVFGPNWFASVFDAESAQGIQDAVGGELRGFD